MKTNLLITGLPGVGKTTLIKKIAHAVRDRKPVGFYTSEIRESGVRKGFEIVGLDGKKGILAHVNGRSSVKVGKYRVDVPGFESFLDSLPFFSSDYGIVIIDEIGKMECLSPEFRRLVIELLNSERFLIAAIARRGSAFIESIKERNDVRLVEVTASNRENLLSEILESLNR